MGDPRTAIVNYALEKWGSDLVERVILFGSRARGDFRPDSDWDAQVLVSNWRYRYNAEIGPLKHENKLPMPDGNTADILVCHPDDYHMADYPAQASVLKDGIDIYVRP